MVCSANIVRSPIAEAMWRSAAVLEQRVLPVWSAGLDALPDYGADPMCVEIADEKGLDLTEHRSRRFRMEYGAQSDLILVMEPQMAHRIQRAAPQLAGRVHLLGRWTVGTIDDPRGGPRPAYERTIGLIGDAVREWLKRIP